MMAVRPFRKPVDGDLYAMWVHQRRMAWDDYFQACEMLEMYKALPNPRSSIVRWSERKSIASSKAQYFDALIAAAIDPTFNRDWAREGVEL